MKKTSRNQQKDKAPLAGLFGIKQFMLVPLAVFGLIASATNMAVLSAF